MELKTAQTIDTDVLVIGGGGTGIRAAIEARKYDLSVLLISKSRVGYGNNTVISGGLIAASDFNKESKDSPGVHFKDTIAAGCSINDRKMVEIMAGGATQQIYDLMKFGVRFRKKNGELLVIHMPGHTYGRQVWGEKMGRSISPPLRNYAASLGIRFKEGVLITKLLKAEDMVVGAIGMDNKGQIFIFKAKATILASGGAGDTYLNSDMAAGSSGDGYALAYENGAILRDMEFVQCYPTAMGKYATKDWPYETCIGGGATLRNSLGEDILTKHGMKDFNSMTRDMVTRAIMIEVMEGRGIDNRVAVDFTTMPEAECKRISQVLRNRPQYLENVRVVSTVHFFMGGIKINERCETGVDGLFAAGEVCGGAHGANRLGGNALAEVLVFGTIAGNSAAVRASKMKKMSAPQSEVTMEVARLKGLASGTGGENLNQLRQSLKQMMWNKAGVIRNKQSLKDTLQEIPTLRERLRSVSLEDYRQLSQAIRLANMLTVSEMVCRAALKRTESRGAHYRTDYPEQNDEQWLKNIEISYESGNMTLRSIPVAIEVG